jgi:cytochrome c biogenesis protein CcdA
MLSLIGLVLSIGLADSMNPSTVGPALYYASSTNARRNATQFTLGVLTVNGLGGALILLGPGQALLSILPHPNPTVRHILEIIAGVAMLFAAALIWRRRAPLGRREFPNPHRGGRSSLWLGVTIAAIELPTAFPYFAAIAAIVGSGFGLGEQLILLAIFNVTFVLPLLLIIATLTFAGDRAQDMLIKARRFLQRHWPELLAGLALLAGTFVTLLGLTGLASAGHGPLGRFSRGFQHLVHRRH